MSKRLYSVCYAYPMPSGGWSAIWGMHVVAESTDDAIRKTRERCPEATQIWGIEDKGPYPMADYPDLETD